MKLNPPILINTNSATRPKKKRKLKAFIEDLVIVPNDDKGDLFSLRNGTLERKNSTQDESSTNNPQNKIYQDSTCSSIDDMLFDRMNNQESKIGGPTIEGSTDASIDLYHPPIPSSTRMADLPTSLLTVSKAEIERRTKKNTIENSEYPNTELVLKPIFLNQPRPPSPVIGPCSFKNEPKKENASALNVDIVDDFSSCKLKWKEDLLSFDPCITGNPCKPALKRRSASASNLTSLKKEKFNQVTVQEFVYANDNPLSINVLLSSATDSKYAGLNLDEFLSALSSTSFKLSSSLKRRLQTCKNSQ